MGKKNYESFACSRLVFEEANDMLGFNLKKMCFEGGMEQLSLTQNAQPALLTVSMAAYAVYKEQVGLTPEFVAGHSLGEITALTCAGAITFSDALRIVRKRGELMQAAVSPNHGMMASITGISQEEMENLCRILSTPKTPVTIACYNSPDQHVISGLKESVEHVISHVLNKGAQAIPLQVSAPFHSIYMKNASEQFKEELLKYIFNPLQFPVISNVTAQPYGNPNEIPDCLAAHMIMPVRWQETMMYLMSQRVDSAIEIGPKKALYNLLVNCIKEINGYSFERDLNELIRLRETLPKWEQMDVGNRLQSDQDFLSSCITIAVCSRNQNWDKDEFFTGVIEPITGMKRRYNQLHTEQGVLSEGEKNGIIDSLRSILAVKGLSDQNIHLMMAKFNSDSNEEVE